MKLKHYWQPTPKKVRKLGDALLAMSMYAQTQEMFTGHSILLASVSIIGLIGKFLTNFFSDEK